MVLSLIIIFYLRFFSGLIPPLVAANLTSHLKQRELGHISTRPAGGHPRATLPPPPLDARPPIGPDVISDVRSPDRMQLVAPLRTCSPPRPSCLPSEYFRKNQVRRKPRSDSPCR